MNQTKVTANDLESVLVSQPVPIEQLQGGMDLLRQRIESGKAFLQVVAYPWGVEFAVCEVGGQA